MVLAILLLFILLPILSLPFVLIGYFYDPKHRTLYSVLFGIFMGLMAYYLQPPVSYDLYRHHQLVDELATYSFPYFIKTLSETSEPLQALINYGISLTHNHDLLQFSVVAIGYAILLYILGDFARRNEIKKSNLLIVLLFTLTSFTCINFFSGLWNSLAMLIFALAFYWDTFRVKSRWLVYALYLITPLVHSAMFLAVLILALYKMFKEKINFKLILIIATLLIAPSIVLPLVSSVTNIPVFSQLEPMYNAYFLNGSQFSYLYGFNVVVMELLKLAFYVFITMFWKPVDSRQSKLRSFILILSISTLILSVSSIVSLRFVLLVQFIGGMFIMAFLNTLPLKRYIIVLGYLLSLSSFFLFYQYSTLRELNFSDLSPLHMLFNLFQLFGANLR